MRSPRRLAPAQPSLSDRQAAAPPPVRAESSSSEGDATEDDEERGVGKLKKKPKKRATAKKAAVVPDWTIPGTQRNGRSNSGLKKRSSTEDRSSRDRADIV